MGKKANDHRNERTTSQRKITTLLTRFVSFVKEEFVADSLDENVPRVNRSGGAHERRKNLLGRKHVSGRLRQLTDHRVVSGRDLFWVG